MKKKRKRAKASWLCVCLCVYGVRGGSIVPMQSGGLGLWASKSGGGHGKETSMSEPHRGDKMAGRDSFQVWSVFKDPCLLLNLAIHLWSLQKAPQSQRQNWWLRDCGYLTNKRFIDSECSAVCKLRSLCEQAGEFKLVLDVQDKLFCFGTCREWAQQRFIVEGFECTDGIK